MGARKTKNCLTPSASITKTAAPYIEALIIIIAHANTAASPAENKSTNIAKMITIEKITISTAREKTILSKCEYANELIPKLRMAYTTGKAIINGIATSLLSEYILVKIVSNFIKAKILSDMTKIATNHKILSNSSCKILSDVKIFEGILFFPPKTFFYLKKRFIFAVPECLNLSKSDEDVSKVANKATPCNDSASVDSAFWRTPRGVVSFGTYINKFFCKMPERKNLKAAKHSNSYSTPNGAKSVSKIAYQRLKTHSDKIDEFLESQGFKDLFRFFAANRKKPAMNLYLYSLNKAYNEFLAEEAKGHCCTELRFIKKYEAANTLFPEAKKELRTKTVKNLKP